MFCTSILACVVCGLAFGCLGVGVWAFWGCFGVFSGAVLGCFSGSVVAVSTCKTWDTIRPRLCVSGSDKQLAFMCHLQSHCAVSVALF